MPCLSVSLSGVQIEVFNVLFVMPQAVNKYLVYCLSCARKVKPGLQKITVLQQYHMSALMKIYDSFVKVNECDAEERNVTQDDDNDKVGDGGG